ncbi:hypothetical protein ACGF13_35330 [Kitasatospora sp. NPDC048286]|uniref:hypothetical protein n=1 Tax=unclassified Kitasatospora TaxID=2633591 RepID=UPI0037148797
MTGTDLLGPYGPGDGGHDEDELRVLLHRAVPALASPKDRVERVLARVERSRRRRRAAGLAAGLTVGLATAVLAAAPALAPAPVRGVGLGPAGSVSAPAPTVPPAQAPTGTPSALPGPPVYFPQLPEMVVALPVNWHILALPAATPKDKFGYLGTQPLGPSCTSGAAYCPISGLLPVDGAVVGFRLVDDGSRGLAEKLAPSPSGLNESGYLEQECATLGGNRELGGRRAVDRAGSRVVVEVTACLRQPSESTLRQVRQVFDTIRSAPAGQPPTTTAVSPAPTP